MTERQVHHPRTNENFVLKALAVTYEALLFSFVLPAAVLLTINRDIGPSTQISWIATSWTLAGAVMQTIAGRVRFVCSSQ